MARNKQTPLKDEQEYDIDDLYRKLDDIMDAINTLTDQKNQTSEQQNGTSEVTTNNFSNCYIRGYQALRQEYFKAKEGLLSDQDMENIGEKFKKKYDEFKDSMVKHGKESMEKEKKRLDEVDDKHEVRTMEQMAEWASEYPVPVQRWMRWFGKNIFDNDEPKETVHETLRVFGDCLMAAGLKPKVEPMPDPTFRDVLLCKWRKVKPWLVRRKLWCYYLFFIIGLAALLCFGIYHNRVMQMDKTNRIFYKTVIQTRRDAEIWQDIDSIVNGFKQHQELQTNPPKKK